MKFQTHKLTLYILMDYQYHGIHLFIEFADVKRYPGLNIYGLIVFNKKPQCYPERSFKIPQKKKKKRKHFHPMREKGKGNSRRKIHAHQERRSIFQRSNATFVTSLVTMLEIFLKGK
jgi:hypothetical protein